MKNSYTDSGFSQQDFVTLYIYVCFVCKHIHISDIHNTYIYYLHTAQKVLYIYYILYTYSPTYRYMVNNNKQGRHRQTYRYKANDCDDKGCII